MLKKLVSIEKVSVTDLIKIAGLFITLGIIYANNNSDHRSFDRHNSDLTVMMKEQTETTKAIKENLVYLNTIVEYNGLSPISRIHGSFCETNKIGSRIN